MERTYKVSPDRIGVVPLGLDPSFREVSEATASLLNQHGVRQPFVLFVGSILPRRRLDLVFDAFRELKKREASLQLVLVGQNRLPQAKDLQRMISSSSDVLHLGYIPDPLLPVLYQQAELSFYLSTYEGYGLPPLEALACGTPAVVSPGQALDDLWPDYPFRSSSLDREKVLDVTLRAWQSRDPQASWRILAQEHLGKLNWRQSAELLLKEIERARAEP